jgi:prepilin-type N-terminal cleavage/methylation domain-containing protein
VIPSLPRRIRSQGGYTLVEVVITMGIGALLMSALISVLFTASKAVDTATSRVEASSQIRSFQSFAYEDFATSTLPSNSSSCSVSTPCATPIALKGATYSWDGKNLLNRVPASTGVARRVASNVSSFSWYVTGCAILVSVTVKVQAYSQSQTFQFYPRVSCP